MKQLMVISQDVYAAGLTVTTHDLDDIASLTAGGFAMIDKDPDSSTYNHVLALAAGSPADTPKLFQFVTNTANGLKWSPIITKANCSAFYQAYVAPVAKIMNIAWTAPSTLTVGQVAGFVVTDTTKGTEQLTRNRTYTRTVVDGDTGATIIAALIASVNADANRVVNATAGTNIVLTRITAGKNFVTSPYGIFSTATITTSTYHVTGTGTAAQLVIYEKDCNPERVGNSGVRMDSALMVPLVSEVNTTTPKTYSTLTFTFVTPNLRPIVGTINPAQQLVIAVEAGLTASGDTYSRTAFTNIEADFNTAA